MSSGSLENLTLWELEKYNIQKNNCVKLQSFTQKRPQTGSKTNFMKEVYQMFSIKQVLTMNNATRNSTTAGKIVNMMSVDVQQIMERMDGIFFGLTTPVQVIVAVVMLYQVVGQLMSV